MGGKKRDGMTNEVERIAGMRDRFELLRKATARMAAAQDEVTELALLRRRVIQELHDMGMSYAEIAQQVGLTRGRIHQIRHAGPPPEGTPSPGASPTEPEAQRDRPDRDD